MAFEFVVDETEVQDEEPTIRYCIAYPLAPDTADQLRVTEFEVKEELAKPLGKVQGVADVVKVAEDEKELKFPLPQFV